jgi:alpha-L-fucosidase 2
LDATEATIILSAATNFVNYHDVSGNASLSNANYMNKVKDWSYNRKAHPCSWQKPRHPFYQ